MIKQTPWIERKFDFQYPVGLFPVILERLRGTIPRLESLVKNVSTEKLESKKNGKWSVKEVVGHLSDLESLWNARISDFLAGKETLTAADMTNTMTEQADHNAQPIEKLLEFFINARLMLLNRVEKMDEPGAAATALHPRLQKPMRLIDSLFFTAEHDDHELTRIRDLINT